MKPFFSNHTTITHHLKQTSGNWFSIYRNLSPIISLTSLSIPSPPPYNPFHAAITTPELPIPNSFYPSAPRPLHSLQVPQNQLLKYEEQQQQEEEEEEDQQEEDGPMNEFLSRFVWIMRQKVSEVYPDCDKATVNGMLLIIVEKVVAEMERGSIDRMLDSARETQSQDFSQDLWRTVWEVSNVILKDMRKARKKEEMKKCLQSEEVKEMVRFAREVGIRGDMLRELRLKWAREKMEEIDFYKNLERLREEARRDEIANLGPGNAVEGDDAPDVQKAESSDGKPKVVLPQRRGKINYRIYGLDLSNPKWAEVADRVHQAEKLITPEEPKSTTGKCKLITNQILSLSEAEDPTQLLAEWAEQLEPARVDWLALLDRLKENKKPGLYFKVVELVLDEESFQTNIRDYSKLIDAHAKENRVGDAERILKKMAEKSIEPDILTSNILVQMYSSADNLDRAKEAFENLRSRGFQPNVKAYDSMIMAYVKAGQPKDGESLMREMEARDIKPTKEIYMELLRAFAQRGHVDGAQRIVNTMQFAGFQPDLESCTLLVEAYGQAGDPDQARNNFDYMIKAGHRPDDRCMASMLAAYAKKNLLDKALNLLLELEKDRFKAGISTYSVLVDWLGKLQLVDEAEQVLGKITDMGEVPFKIHVSLCDMYSRAGVEEKALEALGIVVGKKELLKVEEFERIIHGLLAGGFVADAKRIHELMQDQGFTPSEPVKVALMAAQSIPRHRPGMIR